MVTFKSDSLIAMLEDEPDVFRKPRGARLSLVCPPPDAPDPLALGLRVGTHERPIIGLDGGDGGSPVMDVGAKVWWVVEPLASEVWPPMLCYSTGQIETYRVNVEFAGSPSEAVDYLVRTPMHASAAIFGATICSTKDNASVVVGDLGVAISAAGPTQAGRGGVAITTYPDVIASAGQSGIAIGCTYHGIAIAGVCGQSYTAGEDRACMCL
ncbi:hypothetical protein [Paraliomyxa miuraensis]|uniref:hypothetical protein n=1 Tax=Paraliomyxa miuraensis TaxID=376150 RepID=UPI00224D80D8|nr:hypothetical protein [Paraliomyxa miuraensis]MCX4239725.1 hypothetical protein [Paraliomyxa miuraensis]